MEQSKNQSGGLSVGLSNVNDPIIHTMPKRFINSKEERGTSHKGAGLLILGVGALILATGAIFVYFYVFKESAGTVNEAVVKKAAIDVKIQEKATTIEEAGKDSDNEKTAVNENKPVTSESSNADMAASSSDQTDISSSTLDMGSATNTIKTIDASDTLVNKEYSLAPDADQDGLSDTEEIIFGTSPSVKDSDNDGYTDLAEINNQYNPAGEGKLIVNPGIKKYTDSAASYSLYYPAIWQTSSIDSGNTTVFQIDGMEYIQIIVSDKAVVQSLDDWYQEKFNVTLIKGEQRVYKKGWLGIKSEDGLMYFLSDGLTDKIFTINYVLGDKTMMSYKGIFEMMINTLEKK
jgi:hypothetical protein